MCDLDDFIEVYSTWEGIFDSFSYKRKKLRRVNYGAFKYSGDDILSQVLPKYHLR